MASEGIAPQISPIASPINPISQMPAQPAKKNNHIILIGLIVLSIVVFIIAGSVFYLNYGKSSGLSITPIPNPDLPKAKEGYYIFVPVNPSAPGVISLLPVYSFEANVLDIKSTEELSSITTDLKDGAPANFIIDSSTIIKGPDNQFLSKDQLDLLKGQKITFSAFLKQPEKIWYISLITTSVPD